MKGTNPLLRQYVSARKAWEESENPVISSIRGVTDSVSSFLFDETENAQVTRMLRAMDPGYDTETFQRELREYIVPEVIDAYLSADQQALKIWCGEAVRAFCELISILHLIGYHPNRPIVSSGQLSKPTSNKAS
jgi:mitochondrial import inner membrane translocase subunit TIM44